MWWRMEHMKGPITTGISFGLTSGVITTLGLMVGLHSGTHSAIAVIGGVITIAIADALSDALGIHISEEAKNTQTPKQIWVSTIMTFLTKFVVALSFVIPLLIFTLGTAIIVSVIWGMSIVTILSYQLARRQGVTPAKVIAEHLGLTVAVIALTHFVGDWVSFTFG